jgi:hypothetical protein
MYNVSELKSSVEFCHETILDVQRENEKLRKNVQQLTNELSIIKEKHAIEYELALDNQWRSMRDNLLFHGIHEGKEEDTDNILRQFITKELESDGNVIQFARVHRLGQVKPGKNRPIVAKFERYKD